MVYSFFFLSVRFGHARLRKYGCNVHKRWDGDKLAKQNYDGDEDDDDGDDKGDDDDDDDNDGDGDGDDDDVDDDDDINRTVVLIDAWD